MYTQVNGLRRQGKIRVFIMYLYEQYAQVFMPCLSPWTELFVNRMPAEYSNISCFFFTTGILGLINCNSTFMLCWHIQFKWLGSNHPFISLFTLGRKYLYFIFYVILFLKLRTSDEEEHLANEQENQKYAATFQQGTMGMAAFVLYTFMHCINFPLTWAFALFQFCQPCSQYYTHEKTEAYRLYSETLTHLNMVFTVLFSIECILKLMAFGPKVWSCLEAQYPVDLILSDFTIFFWLLFASLMLFSCLSSSGSRIWSREGPRIFFQDFADVAKRSLSRKENNIIFQYKRIWEIWQICSFFSLQVL